MDTHSIFLALLLILISARIFAELAVRLQLPPVMGELLAGIIIGPSLLGWVSPGEVILLLAEIGIILLLFEVGLETDVEHLISTGLTSVIVAVGGFFLPFLFGFTFSYFYFNLELLTSLFIGGTLTATSIGITVRVMTDLRRQTSMEGQVVLGAALLDDIFGIILLALLYEFATGGGISVLNISKVIIFIGIFFIVATPTAKILSAIINRFEHTSKIPGLIPTTIVSLVFLFAWLADSVGAPELLGGFAAGLALSRRFFLPFGLAIRTEPEFAHRVELQMRPVSYLFTPIFFVTVGLSMNLREVDWGSSFVWIFSLILLVISVLGKTLITFLLKESWHKRLVIGMAMIPRGEVGLVFAELGRSSGIFTNEIYACMIIVIALTTLLPPFFIKWVYKKYEKEFSPVG